MLKSTTALAIGLFVVLTLTSHTSQRTLLHAQVLRPPPIDLGSTPLPLPSELEYHEAPLHLLAASPGDEPPPPVFSPPLVARTAGNADEFLPPAYRPPTHHRDGTRPRAYEPPRIALNSPKVQWTPWWNPFVGQASLLSAPTVPVGLNQLLNLTLRNSPVVELARIDVSVDYGQSKSKVDQLLLSVARNYWEMYRFRAIVIVRERLYHDAFDVRERLKKLIGDSDRELMILAEATARRRLAELAEAHAALHNAQNNLASVVSLPSWEQELELLPQDEPFNGPYHVNEAIELRNALGHRPELQGALRQIQAASYDHQVVRQHRIPRLLTTLRKTVVLDADIAPIQAYAFVSPDIDAISDQIKLDVKNAIVRLAGSYESMRRFSNASQSAAQEVAVLQSRCDSLSASDSEVPLFFRDLLDAQTRLANAEQSFVTSHVNYSAAILELRRANGTIIDQCTFQTGGPVAGPGIPAPISQPAAWSPPSLNQGEYPFDEPTYAEPHPSVPQMPESMFQSPQEPLELPPQLPLVLSPREKPTFVKSTRTTAPAAQPQERPTFVVSPQSTTPLVQQQESAPPTQPKPETTPFVHPTLESTPFVQPPPAVVPLLQSPPDTGPRRRYDFDVPKGELPMPEGEQVIPGKVERENGGSSWQLSELDNRLLPPRPSAPQSVWGNSFDGAPVASGGSSRLLWQPNAQGPTPPGRAASWSAAF